MDNKTIGGLIGTIASGVGTAMQPNEILQIVSLCITIAGGIISLIIIPILNWHKKAKEDGKITKEEIDEGAKILQDGINSIKEVVDNKNKKGGEQ